MRVATDVMSGPAIPLSIHKLALMFAAALFLLGFANCSVQGQTLTVLYAFKGASSSDGWEPLGPLIRDTAGNLYGITYYGGNRKCNCGMVFKFDAAGNETVLHRFTGQSDGANPSGLVSDSAGNLYGTTSYGGDLTCNCGTVFKLDAFGSETILHRFGTGVDGKTPFGGLVRDSAGNLYGTTAGWTLGNCSFGCGTVFKVDSNGNEVVLYTFKGGADGDRPTDTLVLDSKGKLYGTTEFGGAYSSGTVFSLDVFGHETLLHTFTGADGAFPYAGLVFDSTGDLYGAASASGALGYGTVFKLDTARKFSVVYAFAGGADGALPFGDLIWAKGLLYGTTTNGGIGNSGYGTVFKLDATGHHTVLYRFTGADGANPFGRLASDSAGDAFGTTLGGAYGYGTLFELSH